MFGSYKVSALVALLVIAGLTLLPATASAREAGNSSTGCEDEPWETLRVTAQADRARYRIGETVHFTVLVERDLQMIRQGAGDVDVLVSVKIGDDFLGTGGTTDEAGIAQLDIELEPRIRGGKADVFAFAYKDTGVPCLDRGERGHQTLTDLFTVRKSRR